MAKLYLGLSLGALGLGFPEKVNSLKVLLQDYAETRCEM